MTRQEMMAAAAEQREKQVSEICLHCTTWPCRGSCERFKRKNAEVRQRYKDEVARIKAMHRHKGDRR